MEAEKAYNETFRLLKRHHKLFQQAIPLIASENIPSPAVREAIATDFGNRYAEGWPTERVYAGCEYIDQVELICIDLMKKLYKAEFVDVRPISGVVANLVAYTAFTNPGDRMMCLSITTGGHISMGKKKFWGTAGTVHGLKVVYFPYDEENLNIDVDLTKKEVRRLTKKGKSIKMFLCGASVFPFPHPVRDIREIANEIGATVVYDGAHVTGLIAGGQFQDPLREGADCFTMSTHKTLPGPQGGAVASWDKYAETLKKAAFPAMLSNHHLHHVAGKAIAFAEMLKFGKEYTEQIIKNAKALGQALYERGFKVLGEKQGFTKSHVVLIDITNTPLGDGGTVEKQVEGANIIINRNLLPYDIRMGRHYKKPGGIRLGTSEVTRLGMKEGEMEEIAEFIKKIVMDKKNPSKIREDVVELRKNYQTIHYCFEKINKAYEYIRIRP